MVDDVWAFVLQTETKKKNMRCSWYGERDIRVRMRRDETRQDEPGIRMTSTA